MFQCPSHTMVEFDIDFWDVDLKLFNYTLLTMRSLYFEVDDEETF